MKKRLFSILMTLCFLAPAAQAQLKDRLVPHIGFMYESINLRNPTQFTGGERNRERIFYTISVGTYYVIAHKNDVASFGVDPSVNLGFNFLSDFTGTNSGVIFVAQAPVFLMGRLGANSTKYNQQRLGVGAGIGGVYSFFSDGLNKERAQGFNPSAVFEASLLSRQGSLTLRGHMSLIKPEVTLERTSSNFPDATFNDFGVWGVGLIYGF